MGAEKLGGAVYEGVTDAGAGMVSPADHVADGVDGERIAKIRPGGDAMAEGAEIIRGRFLRCRSCLMLLDSTSPPK